MKYRFAGALLVGLLSMSVSTSQGADINITVNGRVVAVPCNIATTNASIDLGDLYLQPKVSWFHFSVARHGA